MTNTSVENVDLKDVLKKLLLEGEGAGDVTTRALIKPLPKKKYRLTFGTHRFPNPEFRPDSVMVPELSHFVAEVGDIVELTDDQYKSFKDKFVPVDESGSDVRDADAAVLERAKSTAARTGEMVDPNQPQPLQAAKDPLREEQKAAAAKKG